VTGSRATEPPEFWLAIENGRTTLAALGAMLGGAAWLGDDDVELVVALGGKVPVSWSPDDTTAAVTLPAGHGVLYLAVAGHLTAEELTGALHGTCRDPRVLSAVIRDVGLSLDR